MKRDEKQVRETLDRFLGRLGESKPSPGQMESAGERVLHRLRKEADRSPEDASFGAEFPAHGRRTRRFGIAAGAAAAAVIAVLASAAAIQKFATQNDAPAVVQTLDGSSYRITGEKVRAVRDVDRVLIRSNEARALVELADGSRVEARPQSEMSMERAADGIRVRLTSGSVIVSAAERRTGRFYVETKDFTVAVTGTVFLVNADEAGSRVAVIEGEVQVLQGPTSKRLMAGEQVATHPSLESVPLVEEILWSRDAASHLALLRPSLTAPTVQPPDASGRLEFAVALIKYVPPDVRTRAGVECRGIDGPMRSQAAAEFFTAPRGACVGIAPLKTLVSFAYGVDEARISGEPVRGAERFQIEAKANDSSTPTTNQLRQMMQTMLVERFRLEFRRVPEDLPGWVFVVSKTGSKLTETPDEEGPQWIVEQPGRIVVTGKSSIGQLADFLSQRVAGLGPIVDRTELKGSYEYTLRFNTAAGPGLRGGRGQRSNVPGARSNAPVFDPPIPVAIEEQLGLRMEPQRVSIERFVIDHVERPSDK